MTREEANKALLKAIEEGDVHKMELAISQGADVNATTTTEPHHPFILLAARSVNPQLCQILIDNGANVNARNDDGTTALMEARSAAVAKTLIRYRAYVNAKNNRGQTALMLVINQNSEESALDHFNVLLNCMASPFAKDNEGNDVFYYIDHNKK
ncbi:MAG: ankyrin repeat domain-containing protein, partial [Alphaproteobacteria bacterium]|nr:ankyrin repeat domain-containing protein [Alphaproteobacteria bacterium]